MHEEDPSSLKRRLMLEHGCQELELQWEFVIESCRKQVDIVII